MIRTTAMLTGRLGLRLRYLLSIVCLSLTLSVVPSVQATPWLDAEELHVRHSLQVLADAGLLSAPVTTFPVMWRPLIADLERLDPATLTPLQRTAYYKLSHLLEYHRRGHYSGFKIAGTTDTGAQPSYHRPMEGKAFATITHERIGQNVAGRLRVTYRTSDVTLNPRVKTDSLSWQGSYAAVMVGDWALSMDQVQNWWSPGSAKDGLQTLSTLPLRSVRATYTPSAASGAMQRFTFTSFWGESEEEFLLQGDTQTWQREQAFGVRAGWRAHEMLELGLQYTESELDDTSQNWAFDARLTLPYQFSFYGSTSEHDVEGVRGNGHMVGFDWSFSEAGSLSRVYAEHDRSDLRSLTTLGYATFRNNGHGYDVRLQDTRVRRDHNSFGRLARWQYLPEFRPGIARIQQVEAVAFYPLGAGRIEIGLQGWKDTYENGREDSFGNVIASYEVRW
ncbi:hypothetical protein CWI70_05665 [Pseudidiomarina homiensis]|uniref:Capsule assembly Wzi family protein n=1 Tax=Pseudidiomarina homiensis TaxID=364198 RepID=A0A432Y5H0_9GAMM|nr:hypothetical protein CWI70_05665 [Pseudidiomarina homiensis]